MPIPRTETSEIVKEIAASGEFGSMLSSIPSDKLSAALATAPQEHFLSLVNTMPIDARIKLHRSILKSFEQRLAKALGLPGVPVEEQVRELKEKLALPITVLDPSVRVEKALESSHVNTLGELVAMTRLKVKSIKTLGEHSAKEIEGKLADLGLSLGMSIHSVPVNDPPINATSHPDLDKPISILELGHPIQRRLVDKGAKTVRQLTKMTEYNIRIIRGIGTCSFLKIKNSLESRNLFLEM